MRSIWKGSYVAAYLQKMLLDHTNDAQKIRESISKKKIWSRGSSVLPEFVGATVLIHNGKNFVRRKITEGMVGHKFGEFALTRARNPHRAKTNKK